MNRADLQMLAETRLREAQALLAANESAGAYYVCGYAAECALKACIARQTQQYDFPDKQKASDSYTHNLSRLLALAGLTQSLNSQSIALQANWAVVKDWSEQARYVVKGAQDAADLLDALTANPDGVLIWLRQHW
jgi:hypothetical protein